MCFRNEKIVGGCLTRGTGPVSERVGLSRVVCPGIVTRVPKGLDCVIKGGERYTVLVMS